MTEIGEHLKFVCLSMEKRTLSSYHYGTADRFTLNFIFFIGVNKKRSACLAKIVLHGISTKKCLRIFCQSFLFTIHLTIQCE